MRFGYFLACEEFGPDELLDQARRAQDAGYDEIYVANIGPNVESFMTLWRDEVLPALRVA